jgi:Kelch motif/Galactose oxidase, central domain
MRRIHAMSSGLIPSLFFVLGCNDALGIELVEPTSVLTEAPGAEKSPPPNSWVEASPMKRARIWHTATLLEDDGVLVVGGKQVFGEDNFAHVEEPELYRHDQASPQGIAENMPRFAHTATLLPQHGTVLIAGGMLFDDRGADLFHPDSHIRETVGALNVARNGHTATLLENGDVMVAGGSRGVLNDPEGTPEVYDPIGKRWTMMDSPMVTARVWHTASRLDNGDVLVAGGWDGLTAHAIDSAELYDSEASKWIPTAPMNQRRQWHTATVLRSGQVLIVGGWDGTSAVKTAELYDPADNLWMPVNSMSSPRCGHTATRLGDGRVLVTGGSEDAALAGAELFDPATGEWTDAASMNVARVLHTATLLRDGRVLVLGGEQESYGIGTALFSTFSPLARAEVYTP